MIEPCGDELLCHFFFGKGQKESEISMNDFSILDEDEMNDSKNVNSAAATTQPSPLETKTVTPHFGASQVIIVRDQRVKNELPEFMKSMLCLTVYESKGLEFDDVILFNFFAMGDIKTNLWKLLL